MSDARPRRAHTAARSDRIVPRIRRRGGGQFTIPRYSRFEGERDEDVRLFGQILAAVTLWMGLS